MGVCRPSYISPLASGKFVAKPYVHVHGAVFFSWILMGIVQPFLITSRRVSAHRAAGVGLAIFALLVWLMGVTMAIISAKVDAASGKDLFAKSFLLIPLTDMLLFGVFVALGVLNYKKPENHKRLMLLATVSILPAAFARFLGSIGVENLIAVILIMNSFVFAGIVYDLYRRRIFHPVYVFGGSFLIITHFSRAFLSETEAWRSIAERILQF